MYEPTPIDRNLKKQVWFKRMIPEHRLLLKDLFYELDSIGVTEIDLDAFYKENDGIIKNGCIDLELFINDCNNDGKERMMLIDRQSKVWFNVTVIFRNANNQGFRSFVSNHRDAAIIKQLAQRSETREWFVNQVVFNERLSVSGKLLNMVYNHPSSTEKVRDFAKRIAKVIGFKILEGKEQTETIKASFGNQCQYCGDVFMDYELEIDHIIPTSKGGHDKFYNKVPACKKCNSNKSDRDVFLFIKESGFTFTEGLKTRLLLLQKKKQISTLPSTPIKRNIKEKNYTYQQVVNFISNNTYITFENYELINPEAEKELKRWRRL